VTAVKQHSYDPPNQPLFLGNCKQTSPPRPAKPAQYWRSAAQPLASLALHLPQRSTAPAQPQRSTSAAQPLASLGLHRPSAAQPPA